MASDSDELLVPLSDAAGVIDTSKYSESIVGTLDGRDSFRLTFIEEERELGDKCF